MTTSLRILLIDDDKFYLEHISDILLELGVTDVLTAYDGKQGLALFDSLEHKPELILCDLNMPKMDGIKFLRHIAERNYQGVISVISNMDESFLKAADMLARAYDLNMTESMGKNIKPQSLKNLLAQSESVRIRQMKKQSKTPPLFLNKLKPNLRSESDSERREKTGLHYYPVYACELNMFMENENGSTYE